MMTLSTTKEETWPSDELPPVGSWKSNKKVIPWKEIDKFPWAEKEKESDIGKWVPTPPPPEKNYKEWLEWYRDRPQKNISEPC